MAGKDSAAACPVGSFNEGGNQRNCTPCPVGMSTASPAASTASACMAVAGWVYLVSFRRHKTSSAQLESPALMEVTAKCVCLDSSCHRWP